MASKKIRPTEKNPATVVPVKRGRGRPPLGDEALTKRLEIRVTQAEYDLVDDVVAKRKTPKGDAETVSTWGRSVLIPAAEQLKERPKKNGGSR